MLGGSFNPAHNGHRHIAETALTVLGLDEIWWLVSPGNPLKSTKDMASLDRRYASAIEHAHDSRMRVTDLERILNTTYTAETLFKIIHMYSRYSFVWIMGADNLIQIPEWKNWSEIFNTVGIAVFTRPNYSDRALAGAAACRFARDRVPERFATNVATMTPPAWVFIHSKLHPESASAIRAATGAGVRQAGRHRAIGVRATAKGGGG